MLLHKDREQFESVLNAVSNELGVPVTIVEKDYYVTMILKQLAVKAPGCVFKGGTSLSKCHHAINRFSEDIDITFIDKVFAICDYYIRDDVNKHSRHIYDLYMLLPKITFDDIFKQLVEDVRSERLKMPKMCPAAEAGIDINEYLQVIVDKRIYEKDYDEITSYFQKERVDYDEAIGVVDKIINSKMFG